MRTAVDHAILRHTVGKICMRSHIAEGKLQDRHSGDIVPIAQGNNVWRDEAEVLGEEGKTPQLLFNLVEQFVARPVHPASMNCVWLAGRDFPELREASEVVQPDKVARLRRPA